MSRGDRDFIERIVSIGVILLGFVLGQPMLSVIGLIYFVAKL